MGFRENLRAELEYQGLLVKELAQKTGIKKTTIDNYLGSRDCQPSVEYAVKIAQALDVSVEYLVTGHQLKNSSASYSPTLRKLINNFQMLNLFEQKAVSDLTETLASHLK